MHAAAEPPRLLVLDVDGTLLDPAKRVTELTAAALDGVRAAGVTVLLATGRIPAGIAALCRQLELSGPQICAHGALVADPLTGEVVAARPLRPEDVRDHVDFARELGIQAVVSDGRVFRATALNPGLEHLFTAFDEPLPELVDADGLGAGRPLKTYFHTGPERYREVIAAARRRFGERYTITSPDDHSVELLAPGVSKLDGLRAAAGWLGRDASDFAAAGDGPNDVELLRAARVSIAMGQAPLEVRAAAGLVTETNGREGLAVALAGIYRLELRRARSSAAEIAQ